VSFEISGEMMQLIGKSKVTKLNAKAGIVYPLIRLPKIYADEIGKTAEIFETKHENKRALVVTFDQQTEAGSEVIQLTPKVIQPHYQQDLEATLCELESQIAELKSLLLENQKSKSSPEPVISSKHPKNKWARSDSNRRPPPCQGDVITS
jgi:hypothetical protein